MLTELKRRKRMDKKVALVRAGGTHYHLDLDCMLVQDTSCMYFTKSLREIKRLKKFNPCKCAVKEIKEESK